MNKKTVRDIELTDKKVIVRVDFNVPLKDGQITDDARIVKALPTLQYILDKRPKCLILMSHLGRPKGKVDPQYSLKPIAEYLPKVLLQTISLLDDCVGDEVKQQIDRKQVGEIVLLENLRFHAQEEKNDPEFAKKLAELADVYVNDAFGTAHRAHASTEGITKYLPSVAGLLLEKELIYFEKALEKPEHPFVAILGGAKVSDKIKLIENLMERVDAILIGGAMSKTFLKAQGIAVGNSKVEDAGITIAKDILKKAESKKVKIYLPLDHVVADDFSETANVKTTASTAIQEGWQGLDIGPKTVKSFCDVLATAKMVVWNGPLGVFEMQPFAGGTRAIADVIAGSEMVSIIGGGDTAAAIKDFCLESKMSHISTGGGASLEYLEGKVLPGVAALANKQTAGSKSL